MKKILIADDHQLFTECLVNTLSDVPDIKIVATAQNGKEALEKIKKHNPSIALLDIGMPVIDGFEAAETIKERHPECKVIMLTARDSIEDIETALRAGIKGYVLKNASREELTTAIDLSLIHI